MHTYIIRIYTLFVALLKHRWSSSMGKRMNDDTHDGIWPVMVSLYLKKDKSPDNLTCWGFLK